MENAPPPRAAVASAHRVVLKLGTRVLTHDDGALAFSRLVSVAETCAALRRQGREVLIVSSGAIGLGRDALGLPATPSEVDERQACAAVGQTRLMSLYQDAFSRMGMLSGQLLLTEPDFDDRDRYLNLRAALQALLRHRVIPIINENDAISTQELALTTGPRPVFGDNDRLSALVASKLEADLLVLFTDVGGLYDRDPRNDPGATLIPRVEHAEDLGRLPDPPAAGAAGRGGMRSKVEAAMVASRGGCHVVITSGREPERWPSVFRGEETGTWFPARSRPHARQRWIAFAAASRGVLVLDDGAVEALTQRHASLLAAGVTAVEGQFRTGDVVELRGGGRRLGRGIIAWDAPTVRAWCAGSPPEGVRNAHALIRRDDIVLETT